MRYRLTHLAAWATLVIVTGCSTQSIKHQHCESIVCLNAATQQATTQDCISALNRPIISRAQQAELDQVYGYPLKNGANYAAFIGTGGRGPSPTQWCKAWAEKALQRAGLAKR